MLNTKNNRFTQAFQKIIKKANLPTLPKPLFSTNFTGIFQIHYEDQFNDTIFNKINTFHMLKNFSNYPKTFLISNIQEFNKLPLTNKYYFLKPSNGYMGTNISISYNKNIFYKNNLEFPLIVQEEIVPKITNGFKSDYRVHVLFLNLDGEMKTYVYPTIVKRECTNKYNQKNNLGLLTIQKKSKKIIIPHIDTNMLECIKNSIPYLKLPKNFNVFLVGYDLIQSYNYKYYILEINSVPNFFNNKDVTIFQTKLLYEIIFICLNYYKNKNIKMNHFIEI